MRRPPARRVYLCHLCPEERYNEAATLAAHLIHAQRAHAVSIRDGQRARSSSSMHLDGPGWYLNATIYQLPDGRPFVEICDTNRPGR